MAHFAGLLAGETLAPTLDELNNYLQTRTFLSGYVIGSDDKAVIHKIARAGEQWQQYVKANGKRVPHLLRYVNFLAEQPEFEKIRPQLTGDASPAGAAPKTDKRTGSKGKYALVPDENSPAVCRFPPEPSGYMHIGHLKAALISNHFARRHPNGKMIVRFDDTNPSKEKDEYVTAILADLKTLNIIPDQVSYTSDYFDVLEQYCERLIKQGDAYVDDSDQATMSQQRKEFKPSPRRDQSVEENLAWWNEMKQGTDHGLKCCVRGKIDYKSVNGALRDPALYRCQVAIPHLRTGTKYKVYPLYDMAIPIVDSLEGITHSLRSNEYHDRNALYAWVQDKLELRKVKLDDFSRLEFKWTLLSKRKLQWFVDNGHVEGWNDPRFPTIQGILRRGMTVEALTEFILSMGSSKTLVSMEMDKLWAINKKIIDPIVPRFSVVDAEEKVLLKLDGAPESVEIRDVPRHKKNPELGNKAVRYFNQVWIEGADAASLKEGEEVTLMDWGNAIIKKITVTNEGTSIEGVLHLAGDFKTTEKKLTWLAHTPDLVPVKLVEFDTLITKEKLDTNEDFLNFLREKTAYETFTLGDANLRLLQKGDRVQIERRGYYICDKPYVGGESPITMFMIPDGRGREHSILGKKVAHRK